MLKVTIKGTQHIDTHKIQIHIKTIHTYEYIKILPDMYSYTHTQTYTHTHTEIGILPINNIIPHTK